MSNVSNFDPNYKEQQTIPNPPTSSSANECITADKLGSMIDISKFNKMMSNTSNVATEFLSSYIKEQNEILPDKSGIDLERYRQTAMKEKRSMVEKHESMMSTLNQLFDYYKNQIINMKSITELHTMLTEQNIKIKKGVEKEIHTIEISDRKTYYENEQNGNVSWWSNIVSRLYKYLIVMIVVAIILKKQYSDYKLWGIVVGLMLYPSFVYLVLDIILWTYNWILSSTKWVYLTL